MSSLQRSEQLAPIRDENTKRIASRRTTQALQPRDSNSSHISRDEQSYLPVPRGESFYAQAKKAEYFEKDLQKAESLYKEAINHKDRIESAIKDLVGVMHQRGNTQEAIEVLKYYKDEFTDNVKYKNLLQNLNRQVVQKGNRLNKFLKVSSLPRHFTSQNIKELFSKPQRIQEVECYENFAIVKFGSHSAARKTLESFIGWEVFRVDWVSITGDVAGEAQLTKDVSYVKDKALFLYKVFLKESQERAMLIDASETDDTQENYQWTHQEEIELLGNDLSFLINN